MNTSIVKEITMKGNNTSRFVQHEDVDVSKRNSISLLDPSTNRLYSAVVFLNHLKTEQFPIERKRLYQLYIEHVKSHFGDSTDALAPNIFTTVTNTVMLTRGYHVRTIKGLNS